MAALVTAGCHLLFIRRKKPTWFVWGPFALKIALVCLFLAMPIWLGGGQDRVWNILVAHPFQGLPANQPWSIVMGWCPVFLILVFALEIGSLMANVAYLNQDVTEFQPI
jgi:hypothetical protein